MPPKRRRLDRSQSGTRKGSRSAATSPEYQGERTPAKVPKYVMSGEEIERIFQPCRVVVKDFWKELKVAPMNGIRERFSVHELDEFCIVDNEDHTPRSSLHNNSAENSHLSTNFGSVEKSCKNSLNYSRPVMRCRSPRVANHASFGRITDTQDPKSEREPFVPSTELDSADDSEEMVREVGKGSKNRGRSWTLRNAQYSASDSARLMQNGPTLSRNVAKRTGHLVNSASDSVSGPPASRNLSIYIGSKANSTNDSINGPSTSRNVAKRTVLRTNSINDCTEVLPISRNVAKRTGPKASLINIAMEESPTSRNVARSSDPRLNSVADSRNRPSESRNVAKGTNQSLNFVHDATSGATSRNMAKRTGPKANSGNDSIEESPVSRNVAKRNGPKANSGNDSIEESPVSQNMAKRTGPKANLGNDSMQESPTSQNASNQTGHKLNSMSDSRHIPSQVGVARGVASICSSRQSHKSPSRAVLAMEHSALTPPPNQQNRTVILRPMATQTENLEDLMFDLLNALNRELHAQRVESMVETRPPSMSRPPSRSRSSSARDSLRVGSFSVGNFVPILSPISPHCSRTIPMRDLILRKRESRVILPTPGVCKRLVSRNSVSPAANPKRNTKKNQRQDSKERRAADSEGIGEVLDLLLPDWPREAPCPKSRKKPRPQSVRDERKSSKLSESTPNRGESSNTQPEEFRRLEDADESLANTATVVSKNVKKRKTCDESPSRIFESHDTFENSAMRSHALHKPFKKRKRSFQSVDLSDPLNRPDESFVEDEFQPLKSGESVREEVDSVTEHGQNLKEVVISPPRESSEDQTLSPAPKSLESPDSSVSDHSYALDPTPKRELKGKIFAVLRKELPSIVISSAEIDSESQESAEKNLEIPSNQCKRLTRRYKVKEVGRRRSQNREEESELARISDYIVESRESVVVDDVVDKVGVESREGSTQNEYEGEIAGNDAEDEEVSMILEESESLGVIPSPLPTVSQGFFAKVEEEMSVNENHCKKLVVIRLERMSQEQICRIREPRSLSVSAASEKDRFDALDFELESLCDSSPKLDAQFGKSYKNQQVVDKNRKISTENCKTPREKTKSGEETKKSGSKEPKNRKKSGDSKSENRSKSHSVHRKDRKGKQGSTSKPEKGTSALDSKASKSNESQRDQANRNTSTSTQNFVEKIVKGTNVKDLATFKIPKKPKSVPVPKLRTKPKIPILDQSISRLPERTQLPQSEENHSDESDYTVTVAELIESAIGKSLLSARPKRMLITSTGSIDSTESCDPSAEEPEKSQVPIGPVVENQQVSALVEPTESREWENRCTGKRATCARFARSWDSKDKDDSDEDLEYHSDLVRGNESPKSFTHRNEIVERSKEVESPNLSPKSDDCDFLEITAGHDDIDMGIGDSVTERCNSFELREPVGRRSFESSDSTSVETSDSISTQSQETVDSRTISKSEIHYVRWSSETPGKVSQPTANRISATITTTDSANFTRPIPPIKSFNNPMPYPPFRPYHSNDSNVSSLWYPVQSRQESLNILTFLPGDSRNANPNPNKPFRPLKEVGICIEELKNPGSCRRSNCLQHFPQGTPYLGQLILEEVRFWVESKDVHRFFHAKDLILQCAFSLSPERLQVDNVSEYHHELIRIVGQELLQVHGLEDLLQFFEPTSLSLKYQERFFGDVLKNFNLRPLLAKSFQRFALHFCTANLKFGSNELDIILEMTVSHAPGMLRRCIHKAMAIQPRYLPSSTVLNDLLLQALPSYTEQIETARLLGSLPTIALTAINPPHLRLFCRHLEEQGPNLPIDLREPLQILRNLAILQSSDLASTIPKACATVRSQTNPDPRYPTARPPPGNFGQYQAAYFFGAPTVSRKVPELPAHNFQSNCYNVPALPNHMRQSTGQEFLPAALPGQYQEVSPYCRVPDTGNWKSRSPERPVPSISTRPVPTIRQVFASTSRADPCQMQVVTKYQFVKSLSSGEYRSLQSSVPVPASTFTVSALGTNSFIQSTHTVQTSQLTSTRKVLAPDSTQPVPDYIPTPKSQLPPPPSSFELPEDFSDSPSSPVSAPNSTESPPSFDFDDTESVNASSVLQAPSPRNFIEPEAIMSLLSLRQFNDLVHLLKEAPPHRLDQIGNSIARYYDDLINQKSSNVTQDFVELVTNIISCNGSELNEDVERTLATVASTIFARFADHDLEFIQQANILMRDCCNLQQWPPYGLCNPMMMELLQVECWIHGGDYLEAAEVLKDFWDNPAKDQMTDLDLKREAETLVRLCHQLIELAHVAINKHRSLQAWAYLYHTFPARPKIPVELSEALPDLMQMATETRQKETIAGMTGIIEQVTKKNKELHGDIDDYVSVVTMTEDDEFAVN